VDDLDVLDRFGRAEEDFRSVSSERPKDVDVPSVDRAWSAAAQQGRA
jgi:hypothetical protein